MSIDEGLLPYLPQTRYEHKNGHSHVHQKAAVKVIDGGFSVNGILLGHSQGLQRRLIDCCCFRQSVGALVIRNSGARLRPK